MQLMLDFRLIFLIIVVGTTHVTFADEQAKLLIEFSGEPPYYVLRVSKSKNRYFVIPPGPCSCSGGAPPFVICSSSLEKDLAEQKSQKKVNENFQCNPSAGCSVGVETIYAECGKKKPRRTQGK